MSDWIEEIKAREQKAEEQRQREIDLRLEDARIIRAKAPAFWEVVTARAEDDCQKLKREFPGRGEYECTFAKLPDVNGFSLSHGLRTISAVLYLDGLSVGLTIKIKPDQLSTPQISMREIAIEVDRTNGLRFSAGGRIYAAPETLAQYLIQETLKIS